MGCKGNKLHEVDEGFSFSFLFLKFEHYLLSQIKISKVIGNINCIEGIKILPYVFGFWAGI